MWTVGQFLAHRWNPELGTGRVVAVAGRRVEVQFPEAGTTLQLAAGTDALVPLALAAGGRARLVATGEEVTLAAPDDGGWRLDDGRVASADALWPLAAAEPLVERLARGEVDAREDWKNRLDGLRLRRLREAEGLGTFLGGRIRLFPHQLHAAERACRADPVRWLFADEVGLGKTVEACLVMTRLLHRGRAERVLVVAPETLTVQWLGELWRKYHQVFVLVDEKRLADVVRDHGSDTNPFDVYRRAIVSLELLARERRLVEHAVAAKVDLLVVDEAHHLERPPGHPGNAEYRAVAALAALGRHVLLLTATPLEEDAHGFFRLLQLLRPDVFPADETFGARLARREPLPPCTSATRRRDVGGLPPRRPRPIEPAGDGWDVLAELALRLRRRSARDELARRRKVELVWRATATAAALEPKIERSDTRTLELVARAKADDPRLAWLAAEATEWARRGEKTLVFVAHRESLDWLRGELEARARLRVGVFHEDLAVERRDLEVAQFRLGEGASVLVSTEAGGEGRNFEFCDRLVLFDLPWSPGVVEQRIGRLDRIGRETPTEVVYFRPPSGLARAVARLHEAIGVFREPLGGLERELKRVTAEVERLAADPDAPLADDAFAGVVAATREARGRVEAAAYHELHRERFRPEMAAEILARVPPDLDAVNEDVVLRAAARFGFLVDEQSGPRTWLVELGYEALVDRLPGVAPGSRFLGTFDRQHAVENETLDFLASGHPLVEGVLTELAEGRRGRVGLFQIAGDADELALAAVYPDPDRAFTLAVVDHRGRRRDDLAARLATAELEHVDAKRFTAQPSWADGVRRLAALLPADPEPLALAAVHVRGRR